MYYVSYSSVLFQVFHLVYLLWFYIFGGTLVLLVRCSKLVLFLHHVFQQLILGLVLLVALLLIILLMVLLKVLASYALHSFLVFFLIFLPSSLHLQVVDPLSLSLVVPVVPEGETRED